MKRAIVDTNLLLVLIVGFLDPERISAFRRTASFDARDYGTLVFQLGRFSGIVVTPHTLTEASNLLGNDESRRTVELNHVLSALILEWIEVHRPASEIVQLPEYRWLGLADAAQIAAAQELDAVLFTADARLHATALATGVDARLFVESSRTA